jgi:hypothetical protein
MKLILHEFHNSFKIQQMHPLLQTFYLIDTALLCHWAIYNRGIWVIPGFGQLFVQSGLAPGMSSL